MVRPIARPLANSIIKGGLLAYREGERRFSAMAAEVVGDLVAEAQEELSATTAWRERLVCSVKPDIWQVDVAVRGDRAAGIAGNTAAVDYSLSAFLFGFAGPFEPAIVLLQVCAARSIRRWLSLMACLLVAITCSNAARFLLLCAQRIRDLEIA